MKKYVIISLLLLLTTVSRGQETLLPPGSYQIGLRSGKFIESVEIRYIDTIRVEFVKRGNLDDIRISEVNSLETKEYYFNISKDGHWVKRNYDHLILKDFVRKSNDTLTGILTDVNYNTMSFRERETTKVKKYWISSVENYSLGNDPFKTSVSGKATDSVTDPTIVKTYVELPAVLNGVDSLESMRLDSLATLQPERETSYYSNSYDRGELDAEKINQSGYGCGGFFLGMTYGSAFLTAGASGDKCPEINVPPGVDRKMYKEGYKNKFIRKRSRAAATGAATAKAIITIVILIALLASN
ncbi:MAG: hypothetical protein WCO63_01710 [Bacteroidota bacterium]